MDLRGIALVSLAPMPRSESTLNLLAEIATIRGRLTDAAHLRGAAAEARANAPDAPSIVRDALAAIRAVGDKRALTNALKEVPADIRLLIERKVIDVATAARLASAGIVTLADLEAAIEQHPDAAPLDAAARQAVHDLRKSRTPIPLGRAWDILDDVLPVIREAGPEIDRVEVVGSTRRFATYSADLEILVSSSDPELTVARLTAGTPDIIRHATPGRAVLAIERSEIGVHVVRPDVFAAALFHLTGSRTHVAAIRARAASRGLSLDWGASDGSKHPAFAQEADLYAALDLPYIAPELREGEGEIDAAAAGRLPALLTVGDMRGDLHMHTDWSDGRHPIDVMVDAAKALGYEYVAVTDHSKSSAIARGLDADRLSQQRDAIAAARERHPQITILHGAEVDILRDGSLDFPDAVLETLDVVLASLHDPGSDSGKRLTDRYISAMRHPLVQIVTHPTNRLVPGRPGYALDEPRFFEAAVDTGTIVEIDGAPGHLDMDGAMARRAIAAGVDVSVDGDCHRAERLGHQMAFGVAMARRGWVTASHVVNTRPLAALKATLARKRTHS